MTLEKIKNLLAEHLEIDAEEITEETTFEDLGVDSLDTVEIMMEMEDEFGIEIKPAEAGKSVAELVKYIDSKL
ncbi:MAG: acyl carrier protein [Clostridia bacterium]|nr:acyl carrier protein [Clostridia bacterium]